MNCEGILLEPQWLPTAEAAAPKKYTSPWSCLHGVKSVICFLSEPHPSNPLLESFISQHHKYISVISTGEGTLGRWKRQSPVTSLSTFPSHWWYCCYCVWPHDPSDHLTITQVGWRIIHSHRVRLRKQNYCFFSEKKENKKSGAPLCRKPKFRVT